MSGLYGWKPPSAARDHLKEQQLREAAERAAVARDRRMQESRDWLAAYHATKHQTRFNWSGTLSTTITKEKDDEEGKASAAGQAAEVGHEEGVGDAAGERSDDQR